MNLTTASVRRLYERFPYPHYPLLLPLQWQDGYLAHSGLSRALAGEPPPSDGGDILSAGCGEALPYIFRHFEPRRQRITGVDLSERSIKRARLRLCLNTKPLRLLADDLHHFLADIDPAKKFDHIDSFGVLHHLPDPTRTLKLLAARSQPYATARFMVYNTPARDWIHHLQRAFLQLGLDPMQSEDRQVVRRFLELAAAQSPALRERLLGLGPLTMRNETRLVDTFLHAHEMRWSPARWLEEFETHGWHISGIYDRYAEWDDHANPLWQTPSIEEITSRCDDGRFEGNLEVYLHRKPSKNRATLAQPSTFSLLPYLRHGPPSAWRGYEETASLPMATLWRLWVAHLKTSLSGTPVSVDHLVLPMDALARRRLARIGAILPQQIASALLREDLRSPLSQPHRLERTEAVASQAWVGSEVALLAERVLSAKEKKRAALRLKIFCARLGLSEVSRLARATPQ